MKTGLGEFHFRWLKKCYRDRESGIKSFDFQPSKPKPLLVLFLMFFVTVFSISAEQQAAIDRLKVNEITNMTDYY